jgi:hypothetical protein
MEPSRIARMEHFALATELSLKTLCARLRDALALPEFQFDDENETEWGWSELDGIEYNVSRPYESQTLRRWDGSVPEGCNVGITVMVAKSHPRSDERDWIVASLVPAMAARLQEALATVVHHHRSWEPHGDAL